MHRSGTSGITGVLVRAGAFAGTTEQLISAGMDNPAGFFERIDLDDACGELLRHAGADWWNVRDFSVDRVPHVAKMESIDRFRAMVECLNAKPPWVIKNPRMCLLLPILLPLLEQPVCVHVYRNPLEVARSLHGRDGIGILEGLALWESYNRSAIENSDGIPSCRVSYDDICADPAVAARSLLRSLDALGVEGLRMPNAVELSTAFDCNLRHEFVPSGHELQYLTPSQTQLWGLLSSEGRLSSTDLPPRSAATIDALSALEEARHNQVDAQCRVRLDAELEQSNAHLNDARQRIAEDEQNRLAMATELGKSEGDNAELRERLQVMTQTLHDVDAHRKVLLGSTSWRITRPLRAVGAIFRRGGSGSAMRVPSFLELNDRHAGETVFIVGAGPQLAKLSDEELRQLERHPCIGVNWTTHKFAPTYFLSAYIGYILLAQKGSLTTLPIHMRPLYEPPLVEGILALRRVDFDEDVGLTRRLEPPEPTLFTLMNVALGATHLALIMGAREVAFIGVEQRNRLHYFHDDAPMRRRILKDAKQLKRHFHMFDIDHPNATFDAMANVLRGEPDQVVSRPFFELSHIETFRAYFSILDRLGVNVYSTSRESVISDAGAEFKPLSELL
jgi:hypothetical protein